MEIQELVEKLKGFDPGHTVELEIKNSDSSFVAPIEDIRFEYGNYVLVGTEYL